MYRSHSYLTSSQAKQPPGTDEKLEALYWGRETYSVPNLATSWATTNDKIRYYEDTVAGFTSGPGTHQNKMAALASRFDVGPTAQEESLDLLRPVYDPVSKKYNLHIDAQEPDPSKHVFTFSDPALMTPYGNTCSWGANHAGNPTEHLPYPTRLEARYLTFTLTIDVAPLYPAVNVSRGVWNISVHLLLAPGTDVLHPQLTKEVLTNPLLTLRTLKSIDRGREPLVGIMHKNHHRTVVELDINLFERELGNYMYQCAYFIMADRLRKSFLGEHRKLSTEAEVQSCRQVTFDKAKSGVIQLSVDEYYTKFLSKVRTLDRTKPYPIDIANTFYIGLQSQLKDIMANDTRFEIPWRPDNESHAAASDRLRTVRDAAKLVESNLRAINGSRTSSFTGTRSTTRGGRSFFTMAEGSPAGTEALMDDLGPDAYQELLLTEQSTQGSSAFATLPPPQQHSDFMKQVIATGLAVESGNFEETALALTALKALVSTAEQAMKQAESPMARRKCWGCGSETHLWRGGAGCPDRDNPSVQQKARDCIRTFTRQPMAAMTMASRLTGLQHTWRDENFASFEVASLICQMADPSTSPETRGSCYSSLIHKSTGSPNKRIIDEVQGATHGGVVTPGSKPYNFYGIPLLAEQRIGMYQATLQRLDSAIQMTHTLPHMRLPIGPPTNDESKPNGTTLALVDTGAGLNVGRLSYHQSIYENHPHLVHEFAFLKDCEGVEPFGLGGVVKGDGDQSAKDIEAIITYKTPYVINGQAVHVSFGLGQNVACNTILSWPFLQALNASIVTESRVVILGRLGAALPYENMVPLRANVAPANAVGTPPSFMARDPSIQCPDIVAMVTQLRQRIDETIHVSAPINHLRMARPSSSGLGS